MDLLLKYIHELPDYLIYLFLGFSALLENLFPPFPGDTITAFGAFLVGTGRLNFLYVYTSTTFGSLLGFISLFLVGGFLGRRFFIRKDYRFFSREKILKVEEWFKKYGYSLILLNRFFPGIRAAISVAAGISALTSHRVIILALISCSIWNLLWMILGQFLGNSWVIVEARLSSIIAQYNLSLFILFAFFMIFLIIRRAYKK